MSQKRYALTMTNFLDKASHTNGSNVLLSCEIFRVPQRGIRQFAMSCHIRILRLFYHRHEIFLYLSKGIAKATETIVPYHLVTRNGVVPIIRFLNQCLYFHNSYS